MCQVGLQGLLSGPAICVCSPCDHAVQAMHMHSAMAQPMHMHAQPMHYAASSPPAASQQALLMFRKLLITTHHTDMSCG